MGRWISTALPFSPVILTLAMGAPTFAAAPPNDNYANAKVITALPFADTVDMSMATGEPAKGESPTQRTVWYRYTPAAAQRVVIESPSFLFTLCVEGVVCDGLFSGCRGAWGPRIVLDLQAGQTFHFQVIQGFFPNVIFNVRVAPPPPPNDDIDQATVIGAFPFTDTVDTVSATRSADDPSGACTAGLYANVWYQFTPQADTFVTLDAPESDYMTQWAILRGTRGALTTVTCRGCFVEPTRLTGGVTHYLMVWPFDPFGENEGGKLSFTIDGVVASPPPANDDFDHATEIHALPFSDSLSVLSATLATDDPPACRFTQQSTVWYRFTPPTDLTVMANTRGSNYNASVEIFTGSRGALTQVNPACPVTTTLTRGVTYHFKVSLASVVSLPGILRFNLNSVAPPRAAVKVFGQPGFTSDNANSGGRSASSLNRPTGVGLDATGEHLYVADRFNNRVLEYQAPATGDTIADHVLGQTDALGGTSFTAGAANIGGAVSARGLSQPTDVTLDSGGNLYVADANNNRVLRYDNPLGTDAVADLVLGQPNFTTGTANTGGRSELTLAFPLGVAVDADGNLYVGEFNNTRAVSYDAPLFSSDDADVVFGEPDFTSANSPGTSAMSLSFTGNVTMDPAGNLYVSDAQGGRVLKFTPPFTTSPPSADLVIGKPDFTTSEDVNVCGIGIGVSAESLCNPFGTAVDCAGNLYVADQAQSRVLIYKDPLTTDSMPDEVLGQPNFTSMEFNWEGTVTARTMLFARGVAVDRAGHLYVADSGNHRVLMFEMDMDHDGLTGAQDACQCEAPSQGLDADHNGCTDTLAGLRAIVAGLSIDPDLMNALLVKLEGAQMALDHENARAATGKLQGFISQIEAKRGKGISDAVATLLVAYANNLIALISASA